MSIEATDELRVTQTIVVAGDILSTNAESVREKVYAQLPAQTAGMTVVMDLRRAAMVDSVGLNLLVSVLKQVKGQGGAMRFLIGSNSVERTFRFTRIDAQAKVIRV